MLDRFNVWASTLVARIQELKSEDGQAMVEYALIVGLVSVIAIVALTAIGVDVNTLFGKVKTALDGAAGA
jgi:pilus assembly protein Flp/PilA